MKPRRIAADNHVAGHPLVDGERASMKPRRIAADNSFAVDNGAFSAWLQ